MLNPFKTDKESYQPFQVIDTFQNPSEDNSLKAKILYTSVLKKLFPTNPSLNEFSPEGSVEWAVLLNLIIRNGILLSNVQDEESVISYCTNRAAQTLDLLKKLKDPRAELSAAENFFLGSLFTPNPDFVQGGQNTLNWMWQRLSLAIPGKTVEDRQSYIQNHRDSIPGSIQRLIDDMEDFESDFQKDRSDFVHQGEVAATALLTQTSFFDRCLDKNCQSAMDILAQLFNRQPKLLHHFTTQTNTYLSQKRSDWDARGYQHIIHNMSFAQTIREKVAPDKWANAIGVAPFVALLANAFYRGAKPTVMADLIDKTHTLPSRTQSLLPQVIQDMIQDIYAPELIMDEKPDFLPNLEISNLFTLLAHANSDTRTRIAALFVQLPQKVQDVWHAAKTNQDRAIFFRLLNETKRGRSLIPILNVREDSQSVWKLLADGLIRNDEMKPVILQAIQEHRTTFLLEPKDMELTPDFPAYAELKDYFRHHPKGLSFIASFSHPHMTADVRFRLASDFVPNKPLTLARLYGLIPYLTRSAQEQEALSFLFQGDFVRQQNIAPRFSQKALDALMTQTDDTGKTPWHYLCERKNRLFFGRHFRALYPSFIQAFQRPDHTGKTPLDFIRSDLKFRQMIAERIPAAEKIMTQAGLSLVYEPSTHKGEKARFMTSVPTPAVQKPQPTDSGRGDSYGKKDYSRLAHNLSKHARRQEKFASRQKD